MPVAPIRMDPMTARRRTRLAGALAGAGLIVAVVSGCGSSAGGNSGEGGLSVVTSTNVYADIVRQIAGPTVRVSAIISNPAQDPHSYEATIRNQLELSRAGLVVQNGGGYDDFVPRMLKASGKSPTTIDVVRLSGHVAVHGELNEHVWYDFPTVLRLTTAIEHDLASKDPSNAATFAKNAAAFRAKVQMLEADEARIKQGHDGQGVAITEPVPLYLLHACGLVNRTPAAFSEAVEQGSDVSVGVLRQTLNLFSDRAVRLLAYNEQTSGVETSEVLAAAKAAGIPAVPVTETLPAGTTYLQWMQDNVRAIGSALA